MKHSRHLLVTIPLAAASITIGAGTAGAKGGTTGTPSTNASCVAQYYHGRLGQLGLKNYETPVKVGELAKIVATRAHDECFD